MKILINGIGRIGKAILRISQEFNLEVLAINELNSNIDNIAYAINYDSTYGNLKDKYIVENDFIKNQKSKIKILNFKDLSQIDLSNIDIVIDSSGSKLNIDKLKQLNAKAVFITHPNKNADINVILGVNENKLNIKKHKIISTSSCNATALLPIVKLIDEKYEIEFGDITTVHPLLNHQKVLDSACIGNQDREVQCNFEFGRSSTQNIIPSGTTTIEACSYLLSKINSSLISSSSLRVPTHTVGAINVTLVVKKYCTKNKLIDICEKYQQNQIHKVLYNNYEPLVSSDFKAMEFTTIIDHRFTEVTKHKMIKLVLWYDNEWGYASKVIDILRYYDKISI